ncbi:MULTISPECIES: PilW family protein [Pseudomonas]|uniref:PilW family protein n=1 Tax=Pseudomonas TaxID=286 RepID=UPI000C11C9DE|nr:hypothetical protein [Pseudomonadaceae bacterium]HCP56016.1 hypothetical protein [Pseudomonas sp.]
MRRSAGFTLISMMVGLLISSIAILGMMSLYKTLVHNAADSIVRSTLDGQVSSALLTAEMELQGAGFAIPGATANNDLVILANASLTADGNLNGNKLTITSASPGSEGNAIIWGADISGAGYRCSGLLAQNGGLTLLQPTPCSAASAYSGAAWNGVQLIAENTLDDEQAVAMSAALATCWPYGKSTSASAVLVSLSAGTSTFADSAETKHARQIADICLPGISQSQVVK